VKSKMGKKFSRRIRAGRSRDLPTDNKLAASPRNTFHKVGASYSLRSESAGRARHSVRAALDAS
jgi:hypothetical protein